RGSICTRRTDLRVASTAATQRRRTAAPPDACARAASRAQRPRCARTSRGATETPVTVVAVGGTLDALPPVIMAKAPYAIAWLLGIPIPILIVVYLVA